MQIEQKKRLADAINIFETPIEAVADSVEQLDSRNAPLATRIKEYILPACKLAHNRQLESALQTLAPGMDALDKLQSSVYFSNDPVIYPMLKMTDGLYLNISVLPVKAVHRRKF